jgi:hypothetical protein
MSNFRQFTQVVYCGIVLPCQEKTDHRKGHGKDGVRKFYERKIMFNGRHIPKFKTMR